MPRRADGDVSNFSGGKGIGFQIEKFEFFVYDLYIYT